MQKEYQIRNIRQNLIPVHTAEKAVLPYDAAVQKINNISKHSALKKYFLNAENQNKQ